MKKSLIKLFIFAVVGSMASCCNNTDQNSQSAQTGTTRNAEIKKVIIKASNNKYLCSDGNLGDTIIANKDVASTWEIFDMILLDSTKIQLKNHKGKFVCADESMNNKCIANKDAGSDWETFTLTKITDTTYSIQNHQGLFFSADQNLGGILIANRKEVGEWEKFKIEYK